MTPPRDTAVTPESLQYPGREFLIPRDRLSPAQQAFITRMESGPRGKAPINQLVWMQHMPFAEVAERFGAYVSAEAPIPARQKEICILLVAAFWDSAFEWHWHERLAHGAGITREQIEAIRNGRSAHFDDDKEQATHDLMRALLVEREVPDALFERSLQTLGLEQVLDLVGLAGLYGMIAHTISFYRLRIPA
ncbi:hypothetical protein FOZ76_12400 [Verticiella sediminum]|uniref:Carboxymuconolactone decarboxylase-like domain-containing protein n=1 Tax=Verticiella sediminum TaxID=1247510 RepID=A0A556ANQ3_9BURK|nr:carboxymuconolactone decarboxylase family protein [Verticiella sediminum]TSH94518.1 hypothetical protein FOZ76_12400 [Verticiella sediminum]